MSANDKHNINLSEFHQFTSDTQLKILEHLLKLSHSDVKYNFQLKVEEITKYDVISNLPNELVEYILSFLQLDLLLKCRQVSVSWLNIINNSNVLWTPYLQKYCINPQGFIVGSLTKVKRTPVENEESKNLNVIGERLFSLALHDDSREEAKSRLTSTEISKATSFIMGKHLLSSLTHNAGFHVIIDQDCRGSNVVMTMNEEVLAYAREDRHIVVKYVNFPHKKINVFEAHQCADMKFYGKYLITGGYDRLICVWEWSSGELVACMEGSLKPVYSLDLINDMLLSTDGKNVISWNLTEHSMMSKTPCFSDDHVEELAIVDITTCQKLSEVYDKPLLVNRSNCEIKLWTCETYGHLRFIAQLEPNKPLTTLYPFIRVFEDKIACSADDGILVWSLVDFTLVSFIERIECEMCDLRYSTIFPRSGNCRVILLYYSELLVLQYYVHENSFQLFSIKPNSNVRISWKMPYNEIWPWSHRKPGIASLFANVKQGFSSTTKLSLFVATQGKKIYGMMFDATDFEADSSNDVIEQCITTKL